jgi:hypothetical protein
MGNAVHGQQVEVGAFEIGHDELQKPLEILAMKREVIVLKIQDSVAFPIALPDFQKNIFRGALLKFFPKRGVDRAEGASVGATPRRGDKTERLSLIEITFFREIREIRNGKRMEGIGLARRVQQQFSISLVTQIGHVV